MKIALRSSTDTRLEFVIEDVTPAFVNALRRTLHAEVPKLAIEDVTIYDNTSALFDEMVAHRLGLLPIPTDLGAFNAREGCPSCGGEGCPSCTVLYTLSKEGPGMVTSGDLNPTDPKFRIADERIPIVKLLEGQRVMLEAAAVLGTGTRHAKWNPVTACGYREIGHVQIGNAPLPDGVAQHIRDSAPEGSVEVVDNKLRVVDEEKAYRYLRAIREVHALDGVKLSTEENKFVFFVETDGALKAKDALARAIHILMDKLKQVETDAGDLKPKASPVLN